MFAPGRPVWSDTTLADFHHHFVENIDDGSGNFLDKIRGQLEGASQDTRLLAVEILFLYFIVVTSVSPKKKREILRAVAEGASEPIPVPDEWDEVLECGLASGGLSFNTGRYWQIVQILDFVQRFRRESSDRQRQLLEDPWEFKDFLYSKPIKFAPVQRNALLHLVFPDHFEPILSGEWKRTIAQKLSEHAPREEEDEDRMIHSIRQVLAEEHGQDFYFWQPGVKELWDPGSVPPKPSRKGGIRGLLPEPGVRQQVCAFLIDSIRCADQQGASCWGLTLKPTHLRLNVGRMQAFHVRDGKVRVVVDRTAMDDATLADLASFRDVGSVYKSFADAVDLVFPAESLAQYAERVRTSHAQVIEGAADRVGVTPYARHHSNEALEQIERELGLTEPLPRPGSDGRTLADLEASLFLEEGSLQAIQDSLKDRGQVILTGPPGTGKTFVARKLANHLKGEDGTVTTVQFHPSYSYEDFVEGFRPVLRAGQTAFELRDGPLKRAADQARTTPDAPHVLLIDEINRGNLAKVFGELYYLLEYREDELLLQYSQTAFSLPRNLWLIGTMNTADRSIALVDLALRRRFHFHEFAPDRDPVKGVLRGWLKAHAPDQEWIADLVEEANRRLGDRHVAIGPSYFLRADIEEQLPAVWEHAVMPYLSEHFFGEENRLHDFQLERLQASLPSGESEG